MLVLRANSLRFLNRTCPNMKHEFYKRIMISE